MKTFLGKRGLRTLTANTAVGSKQMRIPGAVMRNEARRVKLLLEKKKKARSSPYIGESVCNYQELKFPKMSTF